MKKIDYANYITPSDYIPLEEGKNLIRVVSDGGFALKHGMRTARGYVPLGECEGEGCKHCEGGNEPKKVWIWIVYSYQTGMVHILEKGKQIGDEISKLGKEFGDPKGFDIVILRRGTGLKSTYTVEKGDNEAGLGEEVIKDIKASKQRLINKYFK